MRTQKHNRPTAAKGKSSIFHPLDPALTLFGSPDQPIVGKSSLNLQKCRREKDMADSMRSQASSDQRMSSKSKQRSHGDKHFGAASKKASGRGAMPRGIGAAPKGPISDISSNAGSGTYLSKGDILDIDPITNYLEIIEHASLQQKSDPLPGNLSLTNSNDCDSEGKSLHGSID